MIPATVNLIDHLAGDTWEGMSIGPVQFDPGSGLISPPYPVASCRMQFRGSRGELGYEFSSIPADNKGLIIIVDAAAWLFEISPCLLPLAAGKWVYDFETTDTQGRVLTLYSGAQVIMGDVTHD